MAETRPNRTIYLAGELFSAKHLAGNAALADHISTLSGERFRCVLPQDMAQAVSARAIRDQDLRALLGCDAAVFHYDGLELDSGTVVEYLFAKFADIPAVLVRTDFRHAGDQKEGDPWNLMNSFYPRTSTVWLNSMALYQEALANRGLYGSPLAAANGVIERVAAEVCAALDHVLAMPATLPRELGAAVYDWLAIMPGFDNVSGAREEAARLHREKVAKGLL
jgi:nucleoside 2-deoxyribosyltransferase